jgi:hypothetical protein
MIELIFRNSYKDNISGIYNKNDCLNGQKNMDYHLYW